MKVQDAIELLKASGTLSEEQLTELEAAQPKVDPEKAKAKAKKSSSGGKKGPKTPPVADADPSFWLVQHVYQREGEAEALVRANVRKLVNMAGPATAIYTHFHEFGTDCVEFCRYRTQEAE